MTTFEYLAVLLSVVVGLAVAQTLQGLLRILRNRRTTRIYVPALIWTAAILQWTIFFWWFSGYSLVQLDVWRMTTLLFVLVYAAALFFLLGMLYPDDAAAGFDMRGHFQGIRSWFFGVFLGLGLLDAADTFMKQLSGIGAAEGTLIVEYWIFSGIWIVGAAASLRIRDGRILGGIGVLYFVATLYFGYRFAMGPRLDVLR